LRPPAEPCRYVFKLDILPEQVKIQDELGMIPLGSSHLKSLRFRKEDGYLVEILPNNIITGRWLSGRKLQFAKLATGCDNLVRRFESCPTRFFYLTIGYLPIYY